MKRILLAVAVLFAAVSMMAQSPQTSYLLENNAYGYRFNPAFIPQKSFVGLLLSNLTPEVASDIGLSNLVFPTEDGLVTGLNSAVSSEDFLGGLKEVNSMYGSISENLFALGLKGKKGGYFTLEMNLRGEAVADLPYEGFAFLKDAGADSFDLSSASLGGSAWGEVAFGYSRKLGEKVSFGFRIKGLVGLAKLDLDVQEASISLSSGEIRVNADAAMNAACTFMDVATKSSEYEAGVDNVMDFPNFTYPIRNLRPTGYGGAIDLGLMWEPVDGLELNLALNDLGGLAWNYGVRGRTNGEINYKGERISADSEDDKTQFGKEFHAAIETLESLAEFRVEDGLGWKFQAIPFTVNAALRYRMPFYKRLSIGATGSYKHEMTIRYREDGMKLGAMHGRYDARGGFAISPADWFSFTANAGWSSFGPVCGAGLSISGGPLTFFASVDGYIGKIATGSLSFAPKMRIPYPVNSFAYTTSFGFDFQF